MSDTVIRIENLSKKYIIGHQKQEHYTTLRDAIATKVKSLGYQLLKPGKKISNATAEEFWALKDVSFEIKRGEVVGITGRNGAGKSTLLKILSRITEPTAGRIAIRGRVASLLEVGTGFHPELTGRENIYLNGAILGMSRVEIKKKFDEIVAFAEVEKFLDTPVKRYSSGMYVRLAFAVAAHLEPEILVVDEVLAVGDVAFQKKCLGKMGDVATKEGRTVLFVSHYMEAIQELCQRCVLMDQGRILFDDNTERVVSIYLKQWNENLKPNYTAPYPTELTSETKASLLEANILDVEGNTCQDLRFGEPFFIRLLCLHYSSIPGVIYSIRISDDRARFLSAVNTLTTDIQIEKAGKHELICKFEHNVLVPGEYCVTVGCYLMDHSTVYVVEPCLNLIILNIPYSQEKLFKVAGNPFFILDSSWEVNNVE